MDLYDEQVKLEVLTATEQRSLEDQKIDHLNPGTIVHDFQALLDFIARGPLPVGGKYQLLPISVLQDLNERMHEPLIVQLKRPLLKSYPNLQQLYLLLRATGLGVVHGAGKEAVLSLEPDLMPSWNGLNPTERYFNLLETFVDRGNPQILGEQAGGFFAHEPIHQWHFTWEALKTTRGSGGPNQLVDRDFVRYHADALALMWLFGLITIQQGPADSKDGGWRPQRARRTPFGEAIIKQLRNYRLVRILSQTGQPLKDERLNGGQPFLINDESDEPVGLGPAPLGQMRLVFAEIFPEWRNNLTAPQQSFQEGTFILKVSINRSIWRRLSIPATESFDSLADLILRAYKFDHDHLYEFILKDWTGAPVTLSAPQCGDGIRATEVQLGGAGLRDGDAFTFHYDFGDDWMFEVLLERIEPSVSDCAKPKILEKQGKAPEQYPQDEW